MHQLKILVPSGTELSETKNEFRPDSFGQNHYFGVIYFAVKVICGMDSASDTWGRESYGVPLPFWNFCLYPEPTVDTK